ncbi:membrane integrity-associated transporter subunit PqiC [Vibrio aquimaris]|jgi:hypothetical protein|uniref:ABC-type transport auxiliary lipoprotein component domain-containing protein n=1 Tax=Vibrio aquimaris TaxID=2587862 RepID=A0A5P9CFX3_9VIBR|nr:ABC-type transport auxiliary lipoprotein family protein [Vibrio aquimaris]QFT25140.1 hypothetical protein FIV01_01575 [Vibrio aquimaris]
MKNVLLLCCLLFVGCVNESAQKGQQYLLPNNSPAIVASQESPILTVQTELSEYLSGAGIVYRTSDSEVNVAQYNQWAHGIKEQLTTNIIHQLRSKQVKYWPIEPNSSIDVDSMQLYVRVQKFNGVYTGMAEFAGEWLLIDANGHIVMNEYFMIETPLEKEGYYYLVDALSKGIDKLTEDLASKLSHN